MAGGLHSLPHTLLVDGVLLHDVQHYGEPLRGDQRHDEQLQLHDGLLQHDQGVQDDWGHDGEQCGHTGSCSHSQVWCNHILKQEKLIQIITIIEH